MVPVLAAVQAASSPVSSGFVDYLTTIGAIGVVTMALIQTAKDMLPLRRWFQRRRFREWLVEGVGEAGAPDRSATLAARGDHGTVALDADAAERRIVSLATDGDRDALYTLPMEQMCGQISAALQVVLEYPARDRNVVAIVASQAAPGDLAALFAGAGEEAQARLEFANAKTRVMHQFQRAIDAFQIATSYRWKLLMQVASLLLCGVLTFVAMQMRIPRGDELCRGMGSGDRGRDPGWVPRARGPGRHGGAPGTAEVAVAGTLPEISVRAPDRDSGGPVVDVRGALPPGGSVLLLVHGYANSATAARESWAAFLGGLAAAKIGGWMPQNPTGVQWPGDEPIVVVNQAAYPQKIGVSRDSARRIDAFLRATTGGTAGPPILVSIVAHSLGCRLVAELLQCLSQPPTHRVIVDRVVLMAAAVPTDRVDRNQPLRPGVEWAGGVEALYSEGDHVLELAFPIGETVGGDGFFPTAVGRHGGPGSTWLATQQMAHAGALYGHSNYWPGGESAAAAAAFLRIPVAGAIPARATARNTPAESHAIDARQLGGRRIQVRSLPA